MRRDARCQLGRRSDFQPPLAIAKMAAPDRAGNTHSPFLNCDLISVHACSDSARMDAPVFVSVSRRCRRPSADRSIPCAGLSIRKHLRKNGLAHPRGLAGIGTRAQRPAKPGVGEWRNPGAGFAGTPDASVARCRWPYCEINSRARLLVRGPNIPIDKMIISIAIAIMAKTLGTPYVVSRNVTAYPTIMELTRLQLKVNPTAWARMRVG